MSGTPTADRAIAEAQALLDVGRAEAALAALDRAAALDPNDTRPYELMALAHLRLERLQDALQAAKVALGIRPDSFPALLFAASALIQLKKAGEAREFAERAVALVPDAPHAYLVLAEALQATRDEAGARAAADHGVQLAPELPEAHDTLGRILVEHEEYAEAERAFRRALELDATDSQALNNLAVALQRRGRGSKATETFESAARLDPGDKTVRRNLLTVGRSSRGLLASRALVVIFAAFGVIMLIAPGDIPSDRPGFVGVALFSFALAALFEWLRRRRVASEGPTAKLVRDDARARRYKPLRWEWDRPTQFRPWWWALLERVPAPTALLINVLGLALVITTNLVWAILLGVALPFSVLRTYRWWRRRSPSAGSWTPPST